MNDKSSGTSTGRQAKLAAALVHVFTASGLIPVMFSVEAIWQGEAYAALLWLALAMIIDGIDGPLARRFEVSQQLPQIDGAILDHVIDYVSYCFIPALIIYRFDLVPEGWAIAATSLLLMSSLYTFANRELKTAENDFRGFPALWNIVVFYMIMFQTSAMTNLALIVFLSLMVFAPILVAHPIRVVALRRVTLPALIVWTGLVGVHLWFGHRGGSAADLPAAIRILFWVLSFYFVFLSAWRSVKLAREK